MARNADLIQKSCELCGGTHTPFSQSAGGIKSQRQLAQFYNDKSRSFNDKTYIGGMCFSLSMYWLALRKKGDKTLFEWLCPGGIFNKGAINVIVVKNIIELASAIGKKTIAEYVENDQLFEIVKELGVDYCQGFGLARPKPLFANDRCIELTQPRAQVL